jgi:hypothetical protein
MQLFLFSPHIKIGFFFFFSFFFWVCMWPRRSPPIGCHYIWPGIIALPRVLFTLPIFLLPTYLLVWRTILVSVWVTKVKPDVNIVEVNPQPTHKGPFSGWCAGSLWAINAKLTHQRSRWKKIIGRRKLLTHRPSWSKEDKGRIIFYMIFYTKKIDHFFWVFFIPKNQIMEAQMRHAPKK